MYNAGYGFGNAAPNFNAAGQQPGQQGQQVMYNQQFAGMNSQAGFPGANAQMMAAGGMMPNAGMQNMGANGQMAAYQQQFAGTPYGQVLPSSVGPQGFAPNNYMMAGGMQGFQMNPAMNQAMTPQQHQMMQQHHQQQQQQQQHHQQQQQQQQHQQHQHQQQHQQQQQHHQQQQHQMQHQQQQQHHQQQQIQHQPQHSPQQQQQQQQQPPQQQQQQPQPQQQQQQPQAQTPQQQLQQQQQRMQSQQLAQAMSQMGTPQRPPSAAQGAPAGQMAAQQHPQFPTPQPPSQAQTPTNPQTQSVGVVTPQTPTFPNTQGPHANGTASAATPLSPGTESREKERFALLLDINHELLYESIQIQTTQQELKKELALEAVSADRKPTDEENLLQQDYLHCMRRLQSNLSYMAALADRKPEVKVPPCPAYLSAPPLNLSLKIRAQPLVAEGSDANVDAQTDRTKRDQAIKDLYRRLQAEFPGFDPKKEPVYRMPAAPQKPGHTPIAQASPSAHKTPQMTSMQPPMH